MVGKVGVSVVRLVPSPTMPPKTVNALLAFDPVMRTGSRPLSREVPVDWTTTSAALLPRFKFSLVIPWDIWFRVGAGQITRDALIARGVVSVPQVAPFGRTISEARVTPDWLKPLVIGTVPLSVTLSPVTGTAPVDQLVVVDQLLSVAPVHTGLAMTVAQKTAGAGLRTGSRRLRWIRE